MVTLESLCTTYGVRQDGDCLVWTRSLSHGQYGNLQFNGRIWAAHRLFYALLVAAIPDGHHLHHVCGNKACVRPEHVLPVTPKQHSEVDRFYGTKHRTHCPSGHAYTPENTKVQHLPGSNGRIYRKRFCRECHRADGRAHKARMREVAS